MYIKQNLHTHCNYCDGQHSIEENVISAIAKHFDSIGFSSHAPIDLDVSSLKDLDGYLAEIDRVAQKYPNIKIFKGLEIDEFGDFDVEGLDYIIGSKHLLCVDGHYLPVDHKEEKLRLALDSYYGGDFLALAKDYYEGLANMASNPKIDIIGHFDLLTKFNEDESFVRFDDPEYLALAKKAIDKIVAYDKIFEVNTGAISRNCRSLPYPHPSILKYLFLKNAKLTISSDSHHKDHLDCFFEKAIVILKNIGFKTIYVLSDDGFIETEI